MVPPKLDKLLSKVSHPPPGSFDFFSSALDWETGTYEKTSFKKVYIPTERFPDFLRGERDRGQSDFYIRNSSGKQTNGAGSCADKENVDDNAQISSVPTVRYISRVCKRAQQCHILAWNLCEGTLIVV